MRGEFDEVGTVPGHSSMLSYPSCPQCASRARRSETVAAKRPSWLLVTTALHPGTAVRSADSNSFLLVGFSQADVHPKLRRLDIGSLHGQGQRKASYRADTAEHTFPIISHDSAPIYPYRRGAWSTNRSGRRRRYARCAGEADGRGCRCFRRDTSVSRLFSSTSGPVLRKLEQGPPSRLEILAGLRFCRRSALNSRDMSVV